MNRFLCVNSAEQLAVLSNFRGLSPLTPQVFTRHAPDIHWVLIDDCLELASEKLTPDQGKIATQQATILAYCSLWWNHTPPYPPHPLGLIGHYAAQEATAAQRLLQHACQELAKNGCSMAVAPMDGNTWRRYRLMSDRGTEPPFFLEPDNPDEWCGHFLQAEFTPLATYSSALVTDLTQRDARLKQVEQRLQALGVRVRSLNLQMFESELHQIYTLCLTSFQSNFLYTPIPLAEFIAQYSEVKPYIHPEFVLMAIHHTALVGFIFAIPDLGQAKRGATIDTVIIKTVAVLPGRTYAGLGALLVETIHAIAHQHGYTRVIHALMHDANKSRSLSNHYAHTIRRYTLFARLLSEWGLSEQGDRKIP